MITRISRFFIAKCPVHRYSSAFTNNNLGFAARMNTTDQMEYLTAAIDENTTLDWPSLKSKVLSQQGNVSQKNYEGILLKLMVNNQKFEAAQSFANHLRSSSEEMTLGSINGLLGLYFEIGKTRSLTEEEKKFITDAYNSLYEKYKVLDFYTCEKLVRALCVIDEWEKAMWVLEDIHLTSVPSHLAYSILIGTLFKNNKKKKALEMINESLNYKRPLQYEAFEQWINFILRKYKDKTAVLKQLNEINGHIARNYVVIDENTANKIKETYLNLGWDADFSKIKKNNGECIKCNETLDRLNLSTEDFAVLQKSVKEKLIVGSDLLLKSSPEELKKFLSFVEKTAPYDVVIDALNVAYAIGKSSTADRIAFLLETVNYFQQRNKKILLLGRKHMLGWGKGGIRSLMNSTCTFFTDDLSQDDPYFITAAILSGPHTSIVSKDLLRCHQFNLKDENLRYMFKKWQWQNQWMVFTQNKRFRILPPMSFTPCAQKNENSGGWHMPYQSDTTKSVGIVNDGVPDLSNWLCIRRRVNK